MTRIDVERRPGSAMPWWVWLVFALLVLAVALAAWYFLSAGDQVAMTPTDEGEEASPGAPAAGPDADMEQQDLDTILSEAGMPRQFSYGGMTWEAQSAGRLEIEDDRDLIAIGPSVQGHELYYRQGTPTNPYETLYLRGTAPEYTNTFVRYEPVDEQ